MPLVSIVCFISSTVWCWHSCLCVCVCVCPQCYVSSCCRQRSTTWTWFACASRFSCQMRTASTPDRSTPLSPTPSTTTVSVWTRAHVTLGDYNTSSHLVAHTWKQGCPREDVSTSQCGWWWIQRRDTDILCKLITCWDLHECPSK